MQWQLQKVYLQEWNLQFDQPLLQTMRILKLIFEVQDEYQNSQCSSLYNRNKIKKYFFAFLCQHRFWMKLYSFNQVLSVSNSHYFAIIQCPRSHLKTIRNSF